MVSRAFQVLSDAEKKTKYDRFGGDPDSRFGGAPASSASPFSGFAGTPSGGRGPMFEDEISPEELFNRFFGGGMGGGLFGMPGLIRFMAEHMLIHLCLGGGGGPFDSGPQFVFNLGGGPGVRVHQFGGNRPRRRPANASNNVAQEPQSLRTLLSSMLPLLLFLALPLLSSLLSSSTPAGPSFRFEEPEPPYTMQKTSANLKVNYYVNPGDVIDLSQKKVTELDRKAESSYINHRQYECQLESRQQTRMMEDAEGWLWRDENAMRRARSFDKKSCRWLDDHRLLRQY